MQRGVSNRDSLSPATYAPQHPASSLLNQRHVDTRLHDPLKHLADLINALIGSTGDNFVTLDRSISTLRCVSGLLHAEQESSGIGLRCAAGFKQVAKADRVHAGWVGWRGIPRVRR